MHLFSWRERWTDQKQVLGRRSSWPSGSPSCSWRTWALQFDRWPHQRPTSPCTSWCARFHAEDSGGVNTMVRVCTFFCFLNCIQEFKQVKHDIRSFQLRTCEHNIKTGSVLYPFLYYLFHVLIEEIKDVPLLSLHPVSFHMVIPRAPWHWRNNRIHWATFREMLLPRQFRFKLNSDLVIILRLFRVLG